MSQIFPFNPVKNQTYIYNGFTWVFNGDFWVKITPDVNWADNLGSGESVFSYKTGTTLMFKTITQGSNISISATTDEITISSTGGGGTTYERRSDYQDPYLYCGFAVSGSSESSNVWDITRITNYLSGGTLSEYANNVAWTDRYIIIYT